MIAVFLNNKLVTADTVIPFMLEVRRAYPDRPIEFYCADEKTFQILKRNVVLWEAIHAVGSLRNLGSPSRSLAGRVIGLARKVSALARLSLRTLAGGKVHFLHFRALNEAPFSLLSRLNPARTVLMEPTCWGYSKMMIEKVGNQHGSRRWSTLPARCATMIAFSPDWPELHHPAHGATPKLVSESTHFAPAWIDFLSANADRYLGDTLTAAGWPAESKMLVYILGTFGKLGFLRDEDAMLRLLNDTLDALEDYSLHMPVVLKPHAITDQVILRKALEQRPRGRFIVADVHPMVLATRAVAFIGNYISLTFGDARALGVPTVEYTDYSDASLAITGNHSMRAEMVTHFISADGARFRQVLAEIVDKSASSRALPKATDKLKQAIEIFN